MRVPEMSTTHPIIRGAVSEIERLREIAAKATPGPWEVGEVVGPIPAERIPAYTDVEPNIAGGLDVADAQHIAAFDPPTVLGLLDRLEAAEAQVLRVEMVAEDHAGTIAGMDLRAALDGEGER